MDKVKHVLSFAHSSELKELNELTGNTIDEIIEDFLLYCEVSNFDINRDSWTEYIDDTQSFF